MLYIFNSPYSFEEFFPKETYTLFLEDKLGTPVIVLLDNEAIPPVAPPTSPMHIKL